jgi:hypothetical protein
VSELWQTIDVERICLWLGNCCKQGVLEEECELPRRETECIMGVSRNLHINLQIHPADSDSRIS